MNEEKELVKVFNDYKSKHDEFAKAMKKSKETFKMYEGEIKNMNVRIQDLQKLKKDLVGGGTKKKPAQPITMQQVEDMSNQWQSEKEALAKVKEELSGECSKLQEEIKGLKEAKN